MKKDFTLTTYSNLIQALIERDYHCMSYLDFLTGDISENKLVILRHDVDKKPGNSLAKAIIESEFNVRATYYFRTVKSSFDPQIIKKIADLGHEIGYHYEDLAVCHGNTDAALKMFEDNLAKLRDLYPIKTICMHGSPLSRWDNKLIWRQFDYRDYGIIGEPYFDLDYNEFFYITDTGRRWDGDSVSIRDRVDSPYDLRFKSTFEIIDALNRQLLPSRIVINAHPQRWNDSWYPWTKEYIMQSVKNRVKAVYKNRINSNVAR